MIPPSWSVSYSALCSCWKLCCEEVPCLVSCSLSCFCVLRIQQMPWGRNHWMWGHFSRPSFSLGCWLLQQHSDAFKQIFGILPRFSSYLFIGKCISRSICIKQSHLRTSPNFFLGINLKRVKEVSLLAAMTTPSVQSWEELWNQTNLGMIPTLLLINYVIVNLNLNLPSMGLIKTTGFLVFFWRLNEITDVKYLAHSRYSITDRYYFVIYYHFSWSYKVHSSLEMMGRGVGGSVVPATQYPLLSSLLDAKRGELSWSCFIHNQNKVIHRYWDMLKTFPPPLENHRIIYKPCELEGS